MTPKQVLALTSIEKGPLRKMNYCNPLQVCLEGIKRVQDNSEWAFSADQYTYDLKLNQGGVTMGAILYRNSPFAVYRTELRRSELDTETWALTDRWDEHMLAIDAFNLPEPLPKCVTLLDEDVIPAPPKPSSIPLGQIL